jgi:DNA-binding NarL/FixJ family response regulator
MKILANPPLTKRELEVFLLYMQGKSHKEMIAQLHLSKQTVRMHVEHILRKHGLASLGGGPNRRPELIALYGEWRISIKWVPKR